MTGDVEDLLDDVDYGLGKEVGASDGEDEAQPTKSRDHGTVEDLLAEVDYDDYYHEEEELAANHETERDVSEAPQTKGNQPLQGSKREIPAAYFEDSGHQDGAGGNQYGNDSNGPSAYRNGQHGRQDFGGQPQNSANGQNQGWLPDQHMNMQQGPGLRGPQPGRLQGNTYAGNKERSPGMPQFPHIRPMVSFQHFQDRGLPGPPPLPSHLPPSSPFPGQAAVPLPGGPPRPPLDMPSIFGPPLGAMPPLLPSTVIPPSYNPSSMSQSTLLVSPRGTHTWVRGHQGSDAMGLPPPPPLQGLQSMNMTGAATPLLDARGHSSQAHSFPSAYLRYPGVVSLSAGTGTPSAPSYYMPQSMINGTPRRSSDGSAAPPLAQQQQPSKRLEDFDEQELLASLDPEAIAELQRKLLPSPPAGSEGQHLRIPQRSHSHKRHPQGDAGPSGRGAYNVPPRTAGRGEPVAGPGSMLSAGGRGGAVKKQWVRPGFENSQQQLEEKSAEELEAEREAKAAELQRKLQLIERKRKEQEAAKKAATAAAVADIETGGPMAVDGETPVPSPSAAAAAASGAAAVAAAAAATKAALLLKKRQEDMERMKKMIAKQEEILKQSRKQVTATKSKEASGQEQAASQQGSVAQPASKKPKIISPLGVSTTSGLACALIDATESLLVSPSELMAGEADDWTEAGPASVVSAAAGSSKLDDGKAAVAEGTRQGLSEGQHDHGQPFGSSEDAGDQLMGLLRGGVQREEEGGGTPEEEDVSLEGLQPTAVASSAGLHDEASDHVRVGERERHYGNATTASHQEEDIIGTAGASSAFDLRQQLERARSSARAGSTSLRGQTEACVEEEGSGRHVRLGSEKDRLRSQSQERVQQEASGAQSDGSLSDSSGAGSPRHRRRGNKLSVAKGREVSSRHEERKIDKTHRKKVHKRR
ncbi:hypothetical protein CEUSTIGMA_g11752.t1 [Chlamydomonas eustigma]|uniref:Uncharacterized protein n=1 Tax=Chlamydomonas eustigma TaxID=1157962 RepID=A0A250XNE4_9CHLO|nr:hypothetical protein CEUSTIGMA_g11752.t1 [Chlamydomonas eustigma]|eukprot:GAX84330.1 hypothetical protein CEUSTIGMA_g11752.t1 [Chlamydomonas eustigma]